MIFGSENRAYFEIIIRPILWIKLYWRNDEKVKQLVIMGFPIGKLLALYLILLAGSQTCQLFENNQMATHKRSKETHSISKQGFNLLSILISNAIQLKGR